MPGFRDLSQQLLLEICKHYDDLLRKEWWANLKEYEREYEEWPLCPEDHLDIICY